MQWITQVYQHGRDCGVAGGLARIWGDMEGRMTIVNDQGTIADSFCNSDAQNISLDYRSEVFFSHFNAAHFLHPTAVDGRQMWGFSEGEISSVPAVVHLNEMYPGDGKRQLPWSFRSGLWWATTRTCSTALSSGRCFAWAAS